MAGEAEQVQRLARLRELANAELATALRLAEPGDAASVTEVIVTYVPVIAERYGLSASVLAADWYEELRDAAEARGAFSAVLADPPDFGRYESMADWAVAQNDIEAAVAGGLSRIIADMHRGTIMRSSFADPQAAGWGRFAGGGDGSCPFCFMLISRGAVYTEATAKFGAHDRCNCGAGPIFKGRSGVTEVDRYRKSARRREDADGNAIGPTKADQDRARDWIANNL